MWANILLFRNNNISCFCWSKTAKCSPILIGYVRVHSDSGGKVLTCVMQGYREETPFELPVVYRGEELLVPAKLVRFGYTYKIFVELDGREIIFEPDEERNLRAVMEGHGSETIPIEKISAVGAALDRYLR